MYTYHQIGLNLPLVIASRPQREEPCLLYTLLFTPHTRWVDSKDSGLPYHKRSRKIESLVYKRGARDISDSEWRCNEVTSQLRSKEMTGDEYWFVNRIPYFGSSNLIQSNLTEFRWKETNHTEYYSKGPYPRLCGGPFDPNRRKETSGEIKNITTVYPLYLLPFLPFYWVFELLGPS